jgi:hypothetical protein
MAEAVDRHGRSVASKPYCGEIVTKAAVPKAKAFSRLPHQSVKDYLPQQFIHDREVSSETDDSDYLRGVPRCVAPRDYELLCLEHLVAAIRQERADHI